MSERHARRQRRRAAATTSRRRLARRVTTPMLMGVLALAAVAGPGMTSQATLYAEHALGAVQITGATVGDPVGPLVLSSVDAPVASAQDTFPVTGAWGTPIALTAPDRYLVYRKPVASDSWASTPILETATPTFTDESAAHCASYDYRVYAGFKALRSRIALDETIVNDHAAPIVAGTYIEAAPDGREPVGGFLRPATPFYVYAHISDDCALADATLTVDLRSLGVPNVVQFETIPDDGRITREGVSYNFRAGPFTAAASLPDGAAPTWTIRADDGRGNVANVNGRSATVDGTGPSGTTEAVSDTNWYVGAHAAVRAVGGARVHATIEDAGVGLSAATPTVDASSFAVTPSGRPLHAGSFTTGTTSWSWRSDALIVRALGHDSTRDFTITAVDKLGNVGTITGTAHVDNVGARLTSCSMRSVDALWGLGDTTTLRFSEPVLPSDAVDGWAGTPPVGISAVARDGVLLPDFMQHDTDVFGVYSLGYGWVSSGAVSFNGTTLSRTTDNEFQVTYGASSRDVTIPVGAQPSMTLGGQLRDAAGNRLGLATVPCAPTAGAPEASIEAPPEAPSEAPSGMASETQDIAPPVEQQTSDDVLPADSEQPLA